MASVTFKRGTKAEIENTQIQDGQLLMETDQLNNNKIYYTTQNRKMYQINTDGTEQTELAQGRKFVLNVTDKYLTYIDYAEQEAKHILNLETKASILSETKFLSSFIELLSSETT